MERTIDLEPIEHYFQSKFQDMTVQEIVDLLRQCRNTDGAIEYVGNVIDVEVSKNENFVEVSSVLHGRNDELSDNAYHRAYYDIGLREVVAELLHSKHG